MEALIARALVERPQLALDGPSLRVYLERTGIAATTDAESALHAGDLLLACGCVAGNGAALALLEREYIAHVPKTLASRASPASATLPTMVQQLVRQRPSSSITEVTVGDGRCTPACLAYSGRGPLTAWLRVLAVRLTLDLLRKRTPDAPDLNEERAFEEAALGADLELVHIKALYQGEVKQAFAGALAALDARDRTLLRFSLLDGLTVDEMASASRSHRTTVMRNLGRVRELLVSDVRRRLVERLRCGRDEAEELLELVRSRLELSLSRLL